MALSRHLVATPIGALWAAPLFLFGPPNSPRDQALITGRAATPAPVSLIIRSDDAGMSHGVSMALQRLRDAGLPLSVSVMFPCPWYLETVEILKRHPEVAVGIHLTLDGLTSSRFTEAVELVTYRQLVANEGLKAMRRPAG